MAVTDIYEITLKQLDRGQVANNVFTYQQVLEFVTTNPTKAQVLAENFRDQILPSLRNVQPAEVLTTGIEVKNLFNASDGYSLSLSLPGGYGSDREMMPTFNAIGFALNGNNPAVKNGRKSIAGVFEDYVNDGVITGSDLITKLNTLGDKFEAFVTVGTLIPDDVFKPVIVKRVRSGDPGNYEYRMPINAGEAVVSQVVVALFNAIVTSQLSRKIGVGQ